MRQQVLVPTGMLWRPALRGHDQIVVASAAIDQRRLACLTGITTLRMEDQDARVVPCVTGLAAGASYCRTCSSPKSLKSGMKRSLPRLRAVAIAKHGSSSAAS
jgi:hypothetical protein